MTTIPPARFIVFVLLIIAMAGCAPVAPIPALPVAQLAGSTLLNAENSRTLVELAVFSKGDIGPVTALAFTPDGTQLRVVHARTPRLRLWNLKDRSLAAETTLDAVGLGAAAFDHSARNLMLAGVASDLAFSDDYLTGALNKQILGPSEGIWVLDAQTGQLRKQVKGNTPDAMEYFGIALSQDGRMAAVRQTASMKANLDAGLQLDRKSTLVVFSIPEDLTLPAVVQFSTSLYQTGYASDFALDAPGRLLAVYAEDGLIQLWDLRMRQKWGTLQVKPTQSGAQRYLTQMAIDPTRQRLAAFSREVGGSAAMEFVTVWQLAKRQVAWQAPVSFGSACAFAFNPTGDLLAAGVRDGVHIWDATSGTEMMTFPAKTVCAVAFSPDGAQLAWGDWTGAVHLAGLPQ
jgi:WD40 repeat protein